jgi:Spy/CpxP family protein refolding chaperone
MKKLTLILGITMLVATLSFPVFAWAHGGGRGQYNMGSWGGCTNYETEYGKGYGNLTEDQHEKLDKLNRKFYEETAQIRNKIWSKSEELNTLLNSSNLDAEKAKALQKEISELKSKLDQARINFKLEAGKINPDARFGEKYGRGRHMGGGHMMDFGGHMGGYGQHMGGYGQHMGYGRHMGGYGPGGYWN